MSRTLPSQKGLPSTNTHPSSSHYKIFIWDVGTDGRQPHDSAIRSLAAVEYSSLKPALAHYTTAVRLATVNTKKPTPTFPTAWKTFKSFITDHADGKTPLLVSHNAAFDVTVLYAELRRANKKIPSQWRFACSLLFTRSIFPFNTDNSQIALAFRLGVPIKRLHHTAEDVTVLRQILVALDHLAIEQEQPSNRVLPTLYLQARKPAFFDRTPQISSHPDSATTPKVYITQTGTGYHTQTCKWLGRSKIPRDTPPPGFNPCRWCHPQNDVAPKKSSNKASTTSKVPTKSVASGATHLFITKSGSKYHVEGCPRLRKSKIPIDTPPEGFTPCGSCMRHSDTAKPAKGNSRSTSREGSNQKSSKDSSYYITKTGSKYHLKSCWALQHSRIPKKEVPPGYDPCRVCLPNRA